MERQDNSGQPEHGRAYRFIEWMGGKLARFAGIEEPCKSNEQLSDEDFRAYRRQLTLERSREV
jgi:hypothetical protein